MTTLQERRAELARLTKASEAAAVAREAVVGPQRRFEQIEAERRAAVEAIEQAEAQAEQLKAELFDCNAFLADLEPFEDDLTRGIRALDKLIEIAERGRAIANVMPHDVARVVFQCRSSLEYLAQRRADRDRLIRQLKDLGVKP